MTYDTSFYNKKWADVIKKLPKGGSYHLDLRQHGHEIVKDHIEEGSSVFDFACGLGVVSSQLEAEKQCKTAGCDISEVAVNYVKEHTDGDFRVTDEMFGEHYDCVIALQFLEHIPNPVEWLNYTFKYTEKIICSLPNNFNHTGEHTNMQWSSWGQFQKLFKGFTWKRVDKDKYPSGLAHPFKHPIVIFTKEVKNDSSVDVHTENPVRKRSKRTRKNVKTL